MVVNLNIEFFISLLFARTVTAVVLNTPGGVVTEGDLVGYSCTFPCTHSLIAWRVGEDLVIDNNRLSLQGFDRRLRQSGITEASIDVISSCSDSTETGTSRLGIRVTTQLDGTPIQCEALPRDDTSGNSNLYSIFSILHVQPQTVTSTAASEPSPTPSLSSSTCVCAPSYTTTSVATTPSVFVTPSPAPCPSTTPEIKFITRVSTRQIYVTVTPSLQTSGVSRTCNYINLLLILSLIFVALVLWPD